MNNSLPGWTGLFLLLATFFFLPPSSPPHNEFSVLNSGKAQVFPTVFSLLYFAPVMAESHVKSAQTWSPATLHLMTNFLLAGDARLDQTLSGKSAGRAVNLFQTEYKFSNACWLFSNFQISHFHIPNYLGKLFWTFYTFLIVTCQALPDIQRKREKLKRGRVWRDFDLHIYRQAPHFHFCCYFILKWTAATWKLSLGWHGVGRGTQAASLATFQIWFDGHVWQIST